MTPAKLFLAALLLSTPVLAAAQSADAPVIKSGDQWTYQTTIETGPSGWKQTHDTFTVVRTTASNIYFTVQAKGAPTGPIEVIAGADWSRIRNVDGKETTVNRPLAFPLQPGKSWDVSFTEHNPNKAHTLEQWDTHYKVMGYESVEVPAGKFNAIKIEAEGQWIAELAPSTAIVQSANTAAGGTTMVTQTQRTQPSKATGRTYRAVWYAPEVGRWVKAVDEVYNSGGVRSQRTTSELETLQLTGR